MVTLNPASSSSATDAAPRGRLGRIASRVFPAAMFLAVGTLLIVLLGVAQRLGWIRTEGATTPDATAATGEIYTCPMHPQIRQPGKGRCPICGMELVPAASGAGDAAEFSVKIAPAQRRLANIQTAPVEFSSLEATLQTVGSIATDESRQATIAAYIDGRLERLFADYTGVQIQQGDHLAVIYSPQLYAAQVEYVEARRTAGSANGLAAVRDAQAGLATNLRRRLVEFGMTDEQLAELERSQTAQSRLTIYSPQAGTVVEKLAVEGAYVSAGEPIYRIADLSTVWLMLRLFPEDAVRVRFGQRVEATLRSLPSERFTGRVAFIDPTVDNKTRTVGVRVELLNDGRLRPGDYAEARIALPIGPQGEVYDADLAGKWISPMHPQIIRDQPGKCPICGMELAPTSKYGYADVPVPQAESLHVPRSAVLMAGGSSVVYVETESGVFELRPVTLGPVLRDKIVILKGLEAGEQVATAGNFLIDSQMQLAGKPSLIDPTRALARADSPAESQEPGPMELPQDAAIAVEGALGNDIEAFYAAYFKIQKALAADQPPPAQAAQRLRELSTELAGNTDLPAESADLLRHVAEKAEHLHHLELPAARQTFKPISRAVLQLASQVRGAATDRTYIHFYCPMVPDGGGDWLQNHDDLVNPYFGSEMLHCGEQVRSLRAPEPAESDPSPSQDGETAAPGKGT